MYGGNAIDNSLNLTKLGSIENSTTWLNVYSDISDSSGTYLVGSIDSEKKVKKYDITTGAISDATNISKNLQNLFPNAENLYFQSDTFFDSSKFGNLSVVSFIEEGSELGAPKYMEWFGAFGLLVTLVWLYLEILRLLSKLRSR